MATDDALSVLRSEFKLWGVHFEHRPTGGGHIEVRWQVNPDKPLRKTYIPSTASDHRGSLNKRAELRRLFQQDGLSLKAPEKPVPVLRKALSLPQPVETDREQIRAMRGEIGELTSLVIELGGIIAELRDTIGVKPRPEPIPLPAFIPPPPPAPPKPSIRSIKTISYVGENWNSTAALAYAMDLPANIAYRKLYYLMKQNKVELSAGRWRLKPKAVIPLNGARRSRAGMHA